MSQQARLNNVISDWHPLPEGIRHYDSEGDPDRILSYITTLRMEMVCPIERRFNGDTDRGCQPERMSLSLRDSLKKTTDIRVLKCHQEFLLCRTPSDISPKTTLGYCTVTLHTCSNHSFSCQQGETGGGEKKIEVSHSAKNITKPMTQESEPQLQFSCIWPVQYLTPNTETIQLWPSPYMRNPMQVLI